MANCKLAESATNPDEVSTAAPTSVRPEGELAAAVPCLIPSFADAVKLLNSSYSCLVLETHRRHVALPPVHLHKKRSGIRENLDAELLKFSTSLNGVPLAYDAVRVLGERGDIYDDQGFIHFNIEASFVIFRPKKKAKLVGVINKIGVGHVGCLVHGCFNVSVVKPAQLSPEEWRNHGMCVGETLEFEVVHLDADFAGVLLIKGRLEDYRVELLKQKAASADPDPQPTDLSDTLKSKEKKKSKRVREDDDHHETSELNTAAVDSNMNGHQERKRKKSSKRERSPQDTLELDQTAVDNGEMDSNGSHHVKKSKKEKRKEREVSDSGYASDKTSRKRHIKTEEDEVSLSKKKKKRELGAVPSVAGRW